MVSLSSATLHYLLFTATEDGHASEHALKLCQRLADNDAFARNQFEFADRFLVRATALLNHRDSLFHFSISFEISHAYHGVRKITKVDRGFGSSSQSVLS